MSKCRYLNLAKEFIGYIVYIYIYIDIHIAKNNDDSRIKTHGITIMIQIIYNHRVAPTYCRYMIR